MEELDCEESLDEFDDKGSGELIEELNISLGVG